MILYQTTYIEIHYSEKEKLLESFFYGTATDIHYRESLVALIEITKAHDVKRWLCDISQAGAFRIADEVWARREWYPVFSPLASNLEKLAVVKEGSFYGGGGMDGMWKNVIDGKLPASCQEFEDYSEARAWVLD
ncbi:hypothetical protein DXT99_24690 [Pontibacter diazotrophicus]|uniref:STAS/SEC14 domain-containing protein n=1 Tax=Pontibacter diazotrophicus TaxID=1400979 RepID=A0A3D8L220_9BACT|nr:hypothetical protein [Pontibacter diazotrophicus]RDV11461.1 hypothetical protein DXT99_24690 [Pontibacter diazotrophicus]